MDVTLVLFQVALFATLSLISETARRLIQRLAPEAEVLPLLLATSYMCAWLGAAISLALLHKWIFTYWKGAGVPYPVLFTAATVWCKSALALALVKMSRRKLRWPQHSEEVLGIGGVGLAAGVETVLSNLALVQTPLSLCTILRSALLLFVLLIAFASQLWRCSCAFFGNIVLLSAGLAVAVYGDVSDYFLGLILAVGAECIAAMRWFATYKLLRAGGLDVLVVLLCMSPSAMFSSLCCVLVDEADSVVFPAEHARAAEYAILVFGSSFLGVLLLLLELRLTVLAPPLIFSTGAVAKSTATMVMALFVFMEGDNKLRWYGQFLTSLGTLLYSWSQSEHAQADALYVVAVAASHDMLLVRDSLPLHDVQSFEDEAANPPLEATRRNEGRPRPPALTELDSAEVVPAAKVTPESPVATLAQELKQQLGNLERAVSPNDSQLLAPGRSRRPALDLMGDLEEEQPAIQISASVELRHAKSKLAIMAAEITDLIDRTSTHRPSTPSTPALSRGMSPTEAVAGADSPVKKKQHTNSSELAAAEEASSDLCGSCPPPTPGKVRLAASLTDAAAQPTLPPPSPASPAGRTGSLAGALAGAVAKTLAGNLEPGGCYESVPLEYEPGSPRPVVIGAV